LSIDEDREHYRGNAEAFDRSSYALPKPRVLETL
jgi:hypothetical protein